jgi:hypothetical protein
MPISGSLSHAKFQIVFRPSQPSEALVAVAWSFAVPLLTLGPEDEAKKARSAEGRFCRHLSDDLSLPRLLHFPTSFNTPKHRVNHHPSSSFFTLFNAPSCVHCTACPRAQLDLEVLPVLVITSTPNLTFYIILDLSFYSRIVVTSISLAAGPNIINHLH